MTLEVAVSNGVSTWGEYLARKEAEAKQVTNDGDGEVEDKAVKKAATKGRGRKAKTEGEE